MSYCVSPLRYPGGKTKLYKTVKTIISHNGLLGKAVYIEPFAGGSGLALKLLFNNDVKEIVINDMDPAIYWFWKVILENTEEFCKKIEDTSVTLEEWQHQKNIYNEGYDDNSLEFAFSVFFLNRTNVSGVLKGGVIGGLNQTGTYKIDARYNKKSLIERIRKIRQFSDRITVLNFDAFDLIVNQDLMSRKNILINFDPPYVEKGGQLYHNYFTKQDHIELFNAIKKCPKRWIVTYDTAELIKNTYCKTFKYRTIDINYSVNNHTKGSEYMVFSKNLIVPKEM